jgi:hypothetical protein
MFDGPKAFVKAIQVISPNEEVLIFLLLLLLLLLL